MRLKSQAKRSRQRLSERCLANTRDVFDQKMTARRQTRHSQFYAFGFADNDLADLPCESSYRVGGIGISNWRRLVCE
jgi:hypothetical protein